MEKWTKLGGEGVDGEQGGWVKVGSRTFGYGAKMQKKIGTASLTGGREF